MGHHGRIHGRIQCLVDRVRARRGETGPLTIFPIEANADHPAGTRTIWGGRAREIAYDPAFGEPAIPLGGPHKIIFDPEFDV